MRKSALVALLTLLRRQFRLYYFVQKKNKQKNCANPQNPYCLQCCKQERFFILRHRSRALAKTIFTSGLQNGENFAFLRQFSAFYFFLLYFLCRLPFIIVQMLPFKRKLFWGPEYPFKLLCQKQIQNYTVPVSYIARFQKISIPTPRKIIGNSEGEGASKVRIEVHEAIATGNSRGRGATKYLL